MNSDFVFFVVVVVVMGVVSAAVMALNHAACHSRADAMGMRASWGPLQGCMAEYEPGHWWPIDQLRVINGQIVPGSD